MHHFNSSDFKNFSKVYRLNLINSVTGYKSANLIGSQSLDGKENLAIFSSVIHLGSNPALIGFILRPTTVPRHTYSNIKSTGIFTLNAVTKKVISDAHHTSAKYPDFISEFDKTNFEVEKKENSTNSDLANQAIKKAFTNLSEKILPCFQRSSTTKFFVIILSGELFKKIEPTL